MFLLCFSAYAQDSLKDVDLTYGYSEKNPVLLPKGSFEDGPLRERAYFESLMVLDGRGFTYKRLGSCCHFRTENGFFGGAVLDIYEIFIEGIDLPFRVYVNMYDPGDTKPIAMFKFKE